MCWCRWQVRSCGHVYLRPLFQEFTGVREIVTPDTCMSLCSWNTIVCDFDYHVASIDAHTYTGNCLRSSLIIRPSLRRRSLCCTWRFAATVSTTFSLLSIRWIIHCHCLFLHRQHMWDIHWHDTAFNHWTLALKIFINMNIVYCHFTLSGSLCLSTWWCGGRFTSEEAGLWPP